LEPGYYQAQLELNWNEMQTGFFFDIYMKNQDRRDTLYLQQARFYGPMSLHEPSEQYKHYCCDEPCNGFIIDIDSNGIIRFEGRFMKGKPMSNLKYYNSSGERTRTEVYIEGQLKRIK